MSDIKWQSVINMTNGIIGVSILAMPYCFSQVLQTIIRYNIKPLPPFFLIYFMICSVESY